VSRYEKLVKDKSHLERSLQHDVLGKAALVGITAPALGKLASLVGALEPDVVLVDDASEVLESHVLVSLAPTTRHLILVGDGAVPRPGTPSHRLGRQFRLEASMFGRLLARGVQHAALTTQRRSPPHLSHLLASLYPPPRDAAAASAAAAPNAPSVRGVERPLFWIHSDKAEEVEPRTRSRANGHEAAFAAALAVYLLRQGYEPSQLAVLTPYAGQVELIGRELRAAKARGVAGASDVPVQSVFGFEGQEADVVVLSLVRSDGGGSLGPLQADRCAVVSLSRARQGLYVIGNATLFRGASRLWEDVAARLDQQRRAGSEQGAVGDWLALSATRSDTGRPALARSAADFEGVAGN